MISRYPFLQNNHFELLVQCHGKLDFIEKLAIPAFAMFYEDLSQKNQKRVKITFLNHSPDKGIEDQIREIGSNYQLAHTCNVITLNTDTNLAGIFHKSAIQLLDTDQPVKEQVWQSYSFGLPLICLQTIYTKDVLDSGCNIILPYHQPHENIRRISEAINMLYFDQECLKLLKKNAWRRHETYISWSNPSPQESIVKSKEFLT